MVTLGPLAIIADFMLMALDGDFNRANGERLLIVKLTKEAKTEQCSHIRELILKKSRK